VTPQPGDFGVVLRTESWWRQPVEALINWGSKSRAYHAFLAVGEGQLIEAEPKGARLAQVGEHLDAVWSDIQMTDAQRVQIAAAGRSYLGCEYNWLDDLAIGLARRGIAPKWVTRRLTDSDAVMCSQLVVIAYRSAGVDPFPGERRDRHPWRPVREVHRPLTRSANAPPSAGDHPCPKEGPAMHIDSAGMVDEVIASLGAIRGSVDDAGLTGFGWAELRGPDGELKLLVPFKNLITDTGDLYNAERSYPLAGSAKTLTAITTGTTAVATCSAAHHFGVGDVVTIAGVTPAGYNGAWVVTAVGGGSGEDGATTFSFYVGTALGAGSAFGTATGPAIGKANRMRVGTGSTAPAKNGAGAAIVTYVSAITASKPFDATYPQLQDLGAGLGKYTVYKTTWNAGEATQNGLNEIALCIDNLAGDIAGTAAFTLSRALLSPVVNKGASDTLAVTWNHKFLGA